LKIVKLLLVDPRVDPNDQNSSAVRCAAFHGHAEVVKLLLADPKVDPSVFNNTAVRDAAKKDAE